jgi:F0F1-type ATP synthase assembly protein I
MPSDAPDDSSKEFGRKGEADAYGALGLVISGVLVWGAVGWAVSEWLDNRLFVMLGLLLGMGAGLYLVWFRYGRQT